MPGKFAYSVIQGKNSSFPALHGTLVKVGGHPVQRTEECEAWHSTVTNMGINSTITAMQLSDKEAAILVKGKEEKPLNLANGGNIHLAGALWLLCGAW